MYKRAAYYCTLYQIIIIKNLQEKVNKLLETFFTIGYIGYYIGIFILYINFISCQYAIRNNETNN